jgi:hypothetical protein
MIGCANMPPIVRDVVVVVEIEVLEQITDAVVQALAGEDHPLDLLQGSGMVSGWCWARPGG